MSASRRVAAKISQFSGSYLNREWTRKFILGSLLQRYDPPSTEAHNIEDHSPTHSPHSHSTSSTLQSSPSVSSGKHDANHISNHNNNHDPCMIDKDESHGRDRRRAILDTALLRLQRLLGESWSLPVRPLDAASESRILRLLARYACGEGTLPVEALHELNTVLARVDGAPVGVEDPSRMESLLHAMGYALPGDNLRRVAFAGELHYPPSALALMGTHLREEVRQDGGDPFDMLREWVDGPAYAIDSASTSEVDDAIGVHMDTKTGEEYFVVYVSDATVYCPFDSPLEQVTARLLTTTTYLPDGVFFMLPKPIVEAATLREDQPCRTFNIRFQIDDKTGELKNYSVSVGWLRQLRRITYDDVQTLYDTRNITETQDDIHLTAHAPPTGNEPNRRKEDKDKAKNKKKKINDSTHAKANESTQVTSAKGENITQASKDVSSLPGPSWMTSTDADRLCRIHRAASLRLGARQQRAKERFIDANLPEPLIKLCGTTVLSVEDQIISTRDARLAVAEMMIAANEVCSRVAQANRLPIPFRGTRALSADHEAARCFTEPQGVDVKASLDPHHVYFAEAMHHAIQQLSGVTRAVYFHTPIHHAGLDTHHYTHSTSPLRRYADMLVHHQLKVWLWRTTAQGQKQRKGSAMIEQPIAEHTMATLCSMISAKQEQSSLLQDGSQRYWLLRYIEQNILAENPQRRLVGLVGATRGVEAAPEYARFLTHPFPTRTRTRTITAKARGDKQAEDEMSSGAEISAYTNVPGNSCPSIQFEGRWQQRRHEYHFVSDIYIPELQFAHTVLHSVPDVVVGAVVECEVVSIQPTQGHLTLSIVRVWRGGDERKYESLWRKAVLPALDS